MSSNPLDITLLALLERAEPSTRLENVARRERVFTELTVRYFVEHRDQTLALLCELRNFGRTTARELAGIVDRYALVAPAPTPPVVPYSIKTPAQPEWSTLSPELLSVSLRELIRQTDVSVRLANRATAAEVFAQTDIGTFLGQPTLDSIKVRGLGRETLAEVRRLVDDYIAAAISVASSTTAPAVAPAPMSPEEPNAHRGTLKHRVFVELATLRLRAVAPEPLADPRSGILAAVESLSDHDRFVIVRRYGLDGHASRTLAEVAGEAHVTRERVRQVQRGALRRLRQRALMLFTALLDRDATLVRQALCGGRSGLTASVALANRRRLESLQRLAIEIVHGTVQQYVEAVGGHALEQNAKAGAGTEDSASTTILEELLASRCLPRPLADLAQAAALRDDQLLTVLRASPRAKVHQDYVQQGTLGARTRRAIHLHRLAPEVATHGAFDVQTLAEQYRHQTRSPVGSRMVLRELQQHSHLFARLFDNIWLVLRGDIGIHPGAFGHALLPFESRPLLDDGGFDEGTIGSWLVRSLRAGPLRHVDLRDRAVEKLQVSPASIGAVLSMTPCFQRMAPGVFGLYAGGIEPQGDVWINERQCRQYALARFSGAPAGYFPLWTSTFERVLCEWARRHASTEVFRSLMVVVSPPSWGLDAQTLAEWTSLERSHARWSLSTERRCALGGAWPDAHSFFAAIAHTVLFGSIGWFGANRTAQWKLDTHDGADILALLIAMDLVVAPEQWQEPHPATARASDVFEQAVLERWQNGDLSWDHGLFAELLAEARQRVQHLVLGWLDAGELVAMLEAGPASEPEHGRKKAAGSRLGEIEDIFNSSEWDSLFKS
jgi:hypothetical protein